MHIIAEPCFLTAVDFSATLSRMKFTIKSVPTFLHHVEKVDFSTLLKIYTFLYSVEKFDFSTLLLKFVFDQKVDHSCKVT